MCKIQIVFGLNLIKNLNADVVYSACLLSPITLYSSTENEFLDCFKKKMFAFIGTIKMIMRFTRCCSWQQKLRKCKRSNHVLAENRLSLRVFVLLNFVVRRPSFSSDEMHSTNQFTMLQANVSRQIFIVHLFVGIGEVSFVNFVYIADSSCVLTFRLNDSKIKLFTYMNT